MTRPLLSPGNYVLVFHTEEYSGNFECPLIAHVTSRVGECEVGSDEARLARRELLVEHRLWLEEHVLQLPDDHGCHRPAFLWPTPGWFNDGWGNSHRLGADEALVLERRNLSIQSNAESARQAYKDKEHGEREAQRLLERQKEPLRRHPVYQSVAVAFDKKPDGVLEEILRERAREFCADEGIPLTGHDLLRAGPQIFVPASSVKSVVAREQEVHLVTQISGEAFETFGPIELNGKGGEFGIYVRGAPDGKTVYGVIPAGLLGAVQSLAEVNESFRLGLFELVSEIFGGAK